MEALSTHGKMRTVGPRGSPEHHRSPEWFLVFTSRTRGLGVDDGMIRLSIGLETVEDLIEDLSTALDRLA